MSSTVDLRNISENIWRGNSEKLNSVKNMLRKGLVLNFIPIKFEELLAGKRREELSCNKIVTMYNV
jgi:hypothetical protein